MASTGQFVTSEGKGFGAQRRVGAIPRIRFRRWAPVFFR